MVKRRIRFTFNKSARTKAIKALESMKSGSLIGAVVGASGDDPVLAAWVSLLFYLACRITVVVISGIEDQVEPRKRAKYKSADKEEI